MPAPKRAVRPRLAAIRAVAYHWLEQIPFRTAVAVLVGVLVLIGCLATGVIMSLRGGSPPRHGAPEAVPVSLSGPVAQAIRPRPARQASRRRPPPAGRAAGGRHAPPGARLPTGRGRQTGQPGQPSDPPRPRPSPSTTVSVPPVTLTVAPDPAVTGQSVSYIATIRPGAGVASVAFADGGTPITGCRRVVISGGATRCQISYLQAGTHTITAIYTTAGGRQASSAPAVETIVKRG